MKNIISQNLNEDYISALINRFEVQRNEAQNAVAILEAELIKCQQTIKKLEEDAEKNKEK